MADDSLSIIRVGEWKLREIFNGQNFSERIRAGEIIKVVAEERPLRDNSVRGWIPGTMSQEIHYLDKEGVLWAKAHQYYRPDGELAAGGKPDPKRVRVGNVLYRLDVKLNEQRDGLPIIEPTST